jgi:hypothetical protein
MVSNFVFYDHKLFLKTKKKETYLTNFTLDGLKEKVTTRQQTIMTNLKRMKWIKGKGH